MSSESIVGEHLTQETFDSLATPSWDDARREAAEAHLADCDSCRGRLVAYSEESRSLTPVAIPQELRRRVEDLVPHRPPARRSRHPILALAAFLMVALAAGLLINQIQPTATVQTDAPILRGEEADVWSAESPAAGEHYSLAERSAVPFRWPAVDDAIHYRLIILNGRGDRIHEVEVSRTTIEIPIESLRNTSTAAPERLSYFVQASRADGSQERTAVIDFSLAP